MASLFTRIIRGEIPCQRVHEDDRYVAFLDIRPINAGHTLVVPRREVDYVFDLDDEMLSGLLLFARPVARAIQTVTACRRVAIMVAGLEVPHAHVHLVPFHQEGDLTFARAQAATPAALAEMAAKLRAQLAVR